MKGVKRFGVCGMEPFGEAFRNPELRARTAQETFSYSNKGSHTS